MLRFFRPSPNRGHYGGVTRCTGEAIMFCEAAGYDVVIIETVGVGQSEYAVSDLCDIFTLLIPPSSGDELQAIKKGIVELANLIVITKSDGDLIKHSRKMSAEFISATKFINRTDKPKVKRCSALTGEGIEDVWYAMEELFSDQEKIKEKRKIQKLRLLRSQLMNAILTKLEKDINLKEIEKKLKDDDVLLWDVVDELVNKI